MKRERKSNGDITQTAWFAVRDRAIEEARKCLKKGKKDRASGFVVVARDANHFALERNPGFKRAKKPH